MTNWTAINNALFKCDFVETECKLKNQTKRYIHMQIAEQKPTTETHLNPKNNPDVVLMVIDSVASTQLI
ncbi:hypothetical protein OSTOST_24419, partial [Ostertagia ostertagi]